MPTQTNVHKTLSQKYLLQGLAEWLQVKALSSSPSTTTNNNNNNNNNNIPY
jgi:hypothetical protein